MMNENLKAIQYRIAKCKNSSTDSERVKHGGDEEAKDLYKKLANAKFDQSPYHKRDLDEDMIIVEGVILQYWKPRYLMDNIARRAYEFMDSSENLLTISEKDIDIDSIASLSDDGKRRAHNLDGHYPTNIRRYERGVAEVSWQVNPDGMYYMDEDGYGMTDDVEETIYGFIDHKGHAVGKFRFINKDRNLLRQMREEAERVVKMKKR